MFFIHEFIETLNCDSRGAFGATTSNGLVIAVVQRVHDRQYASQRVGRESRCCTCILRPTERQITPRTTEELGLGAEHQYTD